MHPLCWTDTELHSKTTSKSETGFYILMKKDIVFFGQVKNINLFASINKIFSGCTNQILSFHQVLFPASVLLLMKTVLGYHWRLALFPGTQWNLRSERDIKGTFFFFKVTFCIVPSLILSRHNTAFDLFRAIGVLYWIWMAVYPLLQCWRGNWAIYIFYWLGISICYLKLPLFPYPLCELDVDIIVSGFLWHLHTNADSMWTQHPLEIIVWDHSHHYIWCIRSITCSQRSQSSLL